MLLSFTLVGEILEKFSFNSE